MAPAENGIRISRPTGPFSSETLERLRGGLQVCPDVSFAHLAEVEIEGGQDAPGLVLFVWLMPAAVKSLRAALDLVSEAVARALPEGRYVDVVILNSAPELLADLERTGCLLLERDAGERRRALAASAKDPEVVDPKSPGPRWWPF
jgi:hypothetical protein